MAALSISRGFMKFGTYSIQYAVYQRVNVRNYARLLRRIPINTLTAEEAKKLTKKSLNFENDEPQMSTPTTKVQKNPLRNESNNSDFKSNLSVTTFKNGNVPSNEKLHEKSMSYKNKKKEDNLGINFQRKASDDYITLMACGEEVELKIFQDKLTSERKLSSVMQNVKSSRARKASGTFFLEGERLIADALKALVPAEAIFFSDYKLLANLPLKRHRNTELYQINHDKIQLWSDLTTSPGIIGIFSFKKHAQNKCLTHPQSIPLTIICDNIRDPGNMGSIIRCAAAVGCKMLITTPDCVDIWDSKVLRAAAGAHFRIELALGVEWDLLAANFLTQDTTILLADSSVANFSEHSPRHMGEIKKLIKYESENSSPTKTTEITTEGTVQQRDSSYLNENVLRTYKKLPLPCSAYDELNLADSTSVALVVGGETHGLSSAAYKLAHNNGGQKVFIPLENGIDSLNAGVALGILAYEIRRRLLCNKCASNIDVHEAVTAS